MIHLGDEIIQEGFVGDALIERNACRGIIFNDKNEVLFIYSSFYDDVSFPGGGVDHGETFQEALYRECLEEVGVIIDSHKDYYKISEKRKTKSIGDYNVFTSHYYICTYKEITNNCLLDYEIELGYQTKWLNIDEAIKLNEKTLKKLISNNKYTGVVKRELRILNELKKDFI